MTPDPAAPMDGMEIEAKLEAPTEAALLALPEHLEAVGMSCGEAETQIALDHYLDTEDLAFRGAGWALRLRDVGSRKLLTLKALRPSSGGIAAREEHEAEVAWDGSWHFPTDTLDGRVHALAGDAPLTELFALRQDRTQLHSAADDGLWVEVSLDRVRWESGDDQSTAFVAELELRQGETAQLVGLVRRLAEQTGWPPADWSKYEHGLRVAGLA